MPSRSALSNRIITAVSNAVEPPDVGIARCASRSSSSSASSSSRQDRDNISLLRDNIPLHRRDNIPLHRRDNIPLHRRGCPQWPLHDVIKEEAVQSIPRVSRVDGDVQQGPN